ncbi:alpha/beta hydrolase [Streptomyces sp. NPDC059637]|uniref:alpha/beta hydrolase n=1 Tax=Streptomyces sp. NPDC059637 TaxID=3347752 RepID=UPI003687A4B2
MELDPRIRALTDAMAEAGGGDAGPSVEKSRAAAAAMIALQGEPEPVARVVERTAPGPAGPVPLRIHVPEGDGPLPVVVYFPGGGMVAGDLEVADRPARALANAAGAAVVSVDYRKAPEHPYPAAPEDAWAATVWVADNAAALGLDPSRIAVSGDSSGGNLAAVVALTAKDRGGPDLVHQTLVYPAVDFAGDADDYPSMGEDAAGALLPRKDVEWLFAQYLPDRARAGEPCASPIRGDLTGLPAATVVTAGHDPLRDQGRAYADALARAGVPVDYLENPTMAHGFFWMLGAVDHVRGVYDAVGRGLRRAFAAGNPGAAAP